MVLSYRLAYNSSFYTPLVMAPSAFARFGSNGSETHCGVSMPRMNLAAAVLQIATFVVTAILLFTTYEGEGYWGIRTIVFGRVEWVRTYRAIWIAPFVALIAGLGHVAQAFLVNSIVDSGTNSLRWIEHSITTSMCLWLAGSMSGITDWIPLAMLVGLTFVKILAVGHMVHAVKEKDTKGIAVGRALSHAMFVFIFAILITALYTSDHYQPGEIPDMTHVIVWGLLGAGLLYFVPANLYAAERISYKTMEYFYLELSLFVKAAFVWMVVAGRVMLERDDDI